MPERPKSFETAMDAQQRAARSKLQARLEQRRAQAGAAKPRGVRLTEQVRCF